jgi:hypothetical protein
VACRATANMDKNSSKIFMIMRSALQKSKHRPLCRTVVKTMPDKPFGERRRL